MKISKRYRDIPIKVKIPSVMILQAIALNVILFSIVLSILSGITQKNAYQSGDLILTNVRMQIERYMENVESVSQNLLYEDELYSILCSDVSADINYFNKFESMVSLLEKYQNSLEHVETILVARSAREIYESNIQSGSEIDLKTFTMFQQEAAKAHGRPVWITENINLSNSVYMVREVRNPDSGEKIGLIIIHVRKSFIRDICESFNDGAFYYIIKNPEGHDIYVSAGFSDYDGTIEPGSRNIFRYHDYTCFHSGSGRGAVRVIMLVPDSRLYYYKEYLKTILWIVVLGILALFIPVIRYIICDITQPAEQLVKTMKENREDIEYIKLDRHDEWGEIEYQFNKMLDEKEEYQSRLLKQRTDANRTQLKLLQSQINPHFMFNTLDNIKWLVLMNRNKEAEKAIVTLANILGFSMGKYRDEVTVKQEIKNLYDFLYIKKLQYGDRYEIIIDVPESVERCMIPSLTLQPFVENCFKHAISKEKKLTINLKIYEQNNDVLIEIVDDGKGIKEERLAEIIAKMNDESAEDEHDNNEAYISIGIKNVNSRIRLKYGADYGVAIDSVLDEFTRIIIRIPKVGGNDE